MNIIFLFPNPWFSSYGTFGHNEKVLIGYRQINKGHEIKGNSWREIILDRYTIFWILK